MQRRERNTRPKRGFKNDVFENAVALTDANVPNTKLSDREFKTVRFLTNKVFNLESTIGTIVNFCDELSEVTEKLDGITISEGYSGETVFKNYGRVFLIYKNIPYRKSLLIWSKLVKGNKQDRKELYDVFTVALLKRKADKDRLKKETEKKHTEMLNNIVMLLNSETDGEVWLINKDDVVMHYSEYSGSFSYIKRCVKKPLVDVNGIKGIYIKNNKWEDEFVKVYKVGIPIIDTVINKIRVLVAGLKEKEVIGVIDSATHGIIYKKEDIDTIDPVDVVKGIGAVVEIKGHVISGAYANIDGLDAFYPFSNKLLDDALDKGVTFKDIYEYVPFGNRKGNITTLKQKSAGSITGVK